MLEYSTSTVDPYLIQICLSSGSSFVGSAPPPHPGLLFFFLVVAHNDEHRRRGNPLLAALTARSNLIHGR